MSGKTLNNSLQRTWTAANAADFPVMAAFDYCYLVIIRFFQLHFADMLAIS
jgi:hypothetical protein